MTSLDIILVASLLIFFLTIMVVVFFVIYQRRLYRQQEAMRKAEQAYQKELLRASDQSREKEQQRIAQELHDGVGAMLSTSRMYVQQIQRLMGQEKAEEFAQRADTMLGETLTSVRRIAQDLKPVVLETLGLSEALKTLGEKITETGELTVIMTLEALPVLDAESALRVYRMVQEILNNTLKYAGAKTFTLEAARMGEEVVLTAKDDGKGFDASQVKGPDGRGGMGLRTLESRATLLGGSLHVDSTPGSGTAVHIRFPHPNSTLV